MRLAVSWGLLAALLGLALAIATSGPPPSAAAQLPQLQPPHAASTTPISTTSAVFAIDSARDRVILLDGTSGDVTTLNFISDTINLATPRQALLHPDGRVLVLDQVTDAVFAYSLSGRYLGVFAPAGGVDTAILDNARAMAWHPNGQLMVAVGSGPHANSVILFDQAGNFTGRLFEPGSGDVNSPFGLMVHGDGILVSNSSGGIGNFRPIVRFELDGSNPSLYATVNRFPQQIAPANNGNVLIANFAFDAGQDANGGAVEFSGLITGTYVTNHDNASLAGIRGVHQLPGGNYLLSTGNGLYELDAAGTIVDTKIPTNSMQFLSPVELPIFSDLALAVTPLSATVQTYEPVTVTYEISNTAGFTATDVTLNLPALALGTVSGAPSQGTCAETTCALGDLAPGAMATVEVTFTPYIPGDFTLDATVTQSTFEAYTPDNEAVLTLFADGSAPVWLPYLAK